MRKSLRWFYKQPLQQPVKISRHMQVLQVRDDPGVSAHITDFTVQPLSSTVLMSAEIGSGKQSWNARNFIDMLTQSRPPPPPLPPSYCISYSAQPQRRQPLLIWHNYSIPLTTEECSSATSLFTCYNGLTTTEHVVSASFDLHQVWDIVVGMTDFPCQDTDVYDQR